MADERTLSEVLRFIESRLNLKAPPLMDAGQAENYTDVMGALTPEQLDVLETALSVDPQGTTALLQGIRGFSPAADPSLDDPLYATTRVGQILDQAGAGLKSIGGQLGAPREAIGERQFTNFRNEQTMRNNLQRQQARIAGINDDEAKGLLRWIANKKDEAAKVLARPENKEFRDYLAGLIETGDPEKAAGYFLRFAQAFDGQGDDPEEQKKLIADLKADGVPAFTIAEFNKENAKNKLIEAQNAEYEPVLTRLRALQNTAMLEFLERTPSVIATTIWGKQLEDLPVSVRQELQALDYAQGARKGLSINKDDERKRSEEAKVARDLNKSLFGNLAGLISPQELAVLETLAQDPAKLDILQKELIQGDAEKETVKGLKQRIKDPAGNGVSVSGASNMFAMNKNLTALKSHIDSIDTSQYRYLTNLQIRKAVLDEIKAIEAKVSTFKIENKDQQKAYDNIQLLLQKLHDKYDTLPSIPGEN